VSTRARERKEEGERRPPSEGVSWVRWVFYV